MKSIARGVQRTEEERPVPVGERRLAAGVRHAPEPARVPVPEVMRDSTTRPVPAFTLEELRGITTIVT